MKKNDIDTPALLVDSEPLKRNLQRMADWAEEAGVALRPHCKTHKTPEFAKLQLDLGAKGITVAKVGEAEAMAEAGIEDILIANEVIGSQKIERLASLAARAHIALLVDSELGVEQLEATGHDAQRSFEVLIEVDTGRKRCGLSDDQDIVDLAARIEHCRWVKLLGVETYEGHARSGATGAEDIRRVALEAGKRLVQTAAELNSQGYIANVVSVGSTPASRYTPTVDGVTEMRPGTYIFNDVNQMAIGQATIDDCALTIFSSVISSHADRCVLDAGSKSLFAEPVAVNFALEDYQGYGWLKGYPEARIIWLNEEHGVVDCSRSRSRPALGEKIEIIPNHVCPAVNLHEELHLLEGELVTEILCISARGKVH